MITLMNRRPVTVCLLAILAWLPVVWIVTWLPEALILAGVR